MPHNGRRNARSGRGVLAVLSVGLAAGALLVGVGSRVDLPAVLASLSPPVVYTQASHLQDFSIKIPGTWQPGTKLGVQVPSGNILVDVPSGMKPGETFVLDLKQEPKLAAGARQQTLVQKLPQARKELQKSFKGDLTSFQGMLNYERSLRSAMGKLKNKWPTGLKVPRAMMLAHNFIPEEEAPDAEGWDPVNPNGFGAGPPDENNTNGVPGYTYTTNGEDVGVEDKGPGYYQPEDPEHWDEYQKLLRFDCFAAAGQPWRDHANCAALVKRTHTYPNADMFRFSGAFGWNPPFPPGPKATNKEGAVAPDPQEYWNYGSDEDFADAERWDGAAFPPPEEEEEEEESEEEAKAPVTSLAVVMKQAPPPMGATRAADFASAESALGASSAARGLAAQGSRSSASRARQDVSGSAHGHARTSRGAGALAGTGKVAAKTQMAPEALAELGEDDEGDGDGREADEEEMAATL